MFPSKSRGLSGEVSAGLHPPDRYLLSPTSKQLPSAAIDEGLLPAFIKNTNTSSSSASRGSDIYGGSPTKSFPDTPGVLRRAAESRSAALSGGLPLQAKSHDDPQRQLNDGGRHGCLNISDAAMSNWRDSTASTPPLLSSPLVPLQRSSPERGVAVEQKSGGSWSRGRAVAAAIDASAAVEEVERFQRGLHGHEIFHVEVPELNDQSQRRAPVAVRTAERAEFSQMIVPSVEIHAVDTAMHPAASQHPGANRRNASPGCWSKTEHHFAVPAVPEGSVSEELPSPSRFNINSGTAPLHLFLTPPTDSGKTVQLEQAVGTAGRDAGQGGVAGPEGSAEMPHEDPPSGLLFARVETDRRHHGGCGRAFYSPPLSPSRALSSSPQQIVPSSVTSLNGLPLPLPNPQLHRFASGVPLNYSRGPCLDGGEGPRLHASLSQVDPSSSLSLSFPSPSAMAAAAALCSTSDVACFTAHHGNGDSSQQRGISSPSRDGRLLTAIPSASRPAIPLLSTAALQSSSHDFFGNLNPDEIHGTRATSVHLQSSATPKASAATAKRCSRTSASLATDGAAELQTASFDGGSLAYPPSPTYGKPYCLDAAEELMALSASTPQQHSHVNPPQPLLAADDSPAYRRLAAAAPVAPNQVEACRLSSAAAGDGDEGETESSTPDFQSIRPVLLFGSKNIPLPQHGVSTGTAATAGMAEPGCSSGGGRGVGRAVPVDVSAARLSAAEAWLDKDGKDAMTSALALGCRTTTTSAAVADEASKTMRWMSLPPFSIVEDYSVTPRHYAQPMQPPAAAAPSSPIDFGYAFSSLNGCRSNQEDNVSILPRLSLPGRNSFPQSASTSGSISSRGRGTKEEGSSATAGEKLISARQTTVPLSCFAVFDGHCGDGVSTLASEWLEEQLEQAVRRWSKAFESSEGPATHRRIAWRGQGPPMECSGDSRTDPSGLTSRSHGGRAAPGASLAAMQQHALSAALVDALLNLDRAILNVARGAAGDERSDTPTLRCGGGSTATVAAFFQAVEDGADVYRLSIANLGDSRAVMGNIFSGAVLCSTADHRLSSAPQERQRVEGCGGVVALDRLDGRLEVTRSLGDFGYKTAVSEWWGCAPPPTTVASKTSVSPELTAFKTVSAVEVPTEADGRRGSASAPDASLRQCSFTGSGCSNDRAAAGQKRPGVGDRTARTDTSNSSSSPLATSTAGGVSGNIISNIADIYLWTAHRGDILILATDGVWDYMTNEEVMALLVAELRPSFLEDEEAEEEAAVLEEQHRRTAALPSSPTDCKAQIRVTPLPVQLNRQSRLSMDQGCADDGGDVASAAFLSCSTSCCDDRPLATPPRQTTAALLEVDASFCTPGRVPAVGSSGISLQEAANRLTKHVIDARCSNDNVTVILVLFH